jgi:uncharacterized protein YdeI (YjbR/CyaY-like superfamily)
VAGKSDARYFSSRAEFRHWLRIHSSDASELVLGFQNKTSHKVGITYRQAVEEALCFGWIDGVRRRVDEHRYSIRFTPRRNRSIWSVANISRVQELKRLGKMERSGLAAFAARRPERSGIYSFENRPRKFPPAYEADLKRNPDAWKFYKTRAPWYQRTAAFWVLSAKKEETRRKRFVTLIADSARGQLIKPLRRTNSRAT